MAIDKIIDWASIQPDWQQDALRRVAASSVLSDSDISEVLANLKHAKGIPQQESEFILQPLTREHLQSDGQKSPLAHICSVDRIKNVNRLAQGQELKFALDGITLIYGHNGSGKSGYCRILKKFCRATVKDSIHPDVFANGASAPAEARIRYKINGKNDTNEFTWRDGEVRSSDITHLSVFDSKNARLYVDERNRIDYLPYEIELLARFGQHLVRLREVLATEMRDVDYRLSVDIRSGYTTGTAVCELVNRLMPNTPSMQLPTVDEIKMLGTWTNNLAEDLEVLQKTIGDDPSALADRCRRVKNVVSNLVEELTKARDALSLIKLEELEQAVQRASDTDKAASLAATTLFKDDPLQNVGSDPWQLMFNYAKEYSKLVYPNVEPPATGESDLCVLCQQPLSEIAKDRLRRFESYVVGQARRDANKAAFMRDEKIAVIKSVQLRSPDEVTALIGEFASLNDARAEIAASVKKFVNAAHERRINILEAVESNNFTNIAELDSIVIDKLRDEQQALAHEADDYDKATGNNTERENRKNQLATLLDRKRLSENIKLICTRRSDLELRAKLQDCSNGLNTFDLSLQVNALRKELVTEDLNNRIRTEVNALDLAQIPLLINDDSRKGESRYTVTLDTKENVPSRDVLSEGEQQALGLACFLADISGQPVKHGIIVDDPVSSLDHMRLRRVASRLVKEAAEGRQVIIFTHNLLFFSEIMSFAAENVSNPVPVLTNMIRKTTGPSFGVVEFDDQPWEAKRTTERIKLLTGKITELENIHEKDGDVYRESVEGFYTDLRETWERLVEEILLFKVVERFGSDVKTQNLKRVIVNNEDYRKIFWTMKRVSERSGHDMAAAKNMPLPKIDDMKKEISALQTYIKEIRARANDVEIERKKLEKPPIAKTA